MAALERQTKVESVYYTIDPKAISKESLYGSLDPTTREWTDGLFTHILRKIVDNSRGKDERRHWIVFDGDVDPEWVENLNRWVWYECAPAGLAYMTEQCAGRQQTTHSAEWRETESPTQYSDHVRSREPPLCHSRHREPVRDGLV